MPALHPVYVRGEAYLAAHLGNEAAVEFQKILDHRGVVLCEPIGALAHLQLGRAYAMQSDTAKARAAYQEFLTLWKDADPDIPILYLFTGWRAFSEQVLKIPLDKFRDFGYVKLREFEHGVAEELPSSWPHRKIKAEDRLPSAAVAQYSRRE